MKRSMAAAAVLAACVGLAWLGDWRTAEADMPVAAAAGDGSSLASHLIPGENQVHTLVLVDGRTKRICVYHINTASGVSTLKSARDVRYDLQLEDFNTDKPTPREVLQALSDR